MDVRPYILHKRFPTREIILTSRNQVRALKHKMALFFQIIKSTIKLSAALSVLTGESGGSYILLTD